MSELHQALERLNGSLSNLETSVTGLEHNLAGEQRDMFGHPSPSNENTIDVEGGTAIDAALVAQRLDIAIERVEQVLNEAATA
ncbi:MAG: hypothetical protein AB8B83_07010 [Bdellovibrionales bacterium]